MAREEMPPVVVLRPEPGNAATAARVEAAGLTAIRMPIFAEQALAWQAPDAAPFDALLVTSARAVRLAGDGLATLARLPVVAVGAETAAAARAAGLTVALVGTTDAAAAIRIARDAGYARLLHLAGRQRTASIAMVEAVTVYQSVQVREPDAPPGAIVLVHSARAAAALATTTGPRASIAVVAISDTVRAAAGDGWRTAQVAVTPTDAAMVAAALALAIDPLRSGGDNAA